MNNNDNNEVTFINDFTNLQLFISNNNNKSNIRDSLRWNARGLFSSMYQRIAILASNNALNSSRIQENSTTDLHPRFPFLPRWDKNIYS